MTVVALTDGHQRHPDLNPEIKQTPADKTQGPDQDHQDKKEDQVHLTQKTRRKFT